MLLFIGSIRVSLSFKLSSIPVLASEWCLILVVVSLNPWRSLISPSHQQGNTFFVFLFSLMVFIVNTLYSSIVWFNCE